MFFWQPLGLADVSHHTDSQSDDRHRRRHPLVFPAFLLALFLLVWPTQADLVFSLLTRGQVGSAILMVLSFTSVAALPMIIASIRIRRDPGKWKLGCFGILTYGIIIWNLLSALVLLIYGEMK